VVGSTAEAGPGAVVGAAAEVGSEAEVGSAAVVGSAAWDGSTDEVADVEEVADVLGILEVADDAAFVVRKASGALVTIPRERALAGKTVPPPPRRGRPVLPGEGMPQAPSER